MKKGLVTLLVLCNCFTFALAQSWQRVQLMPFSEPGLRDVILWGDTGIVIDGNGKIFKSNDFFQAYIIDSSYKGNGLDAISFANREIGYITSCTIPGGVLKTTDGGNTWNALPSAPSCIGEALVFISPDTGFSAVHALAHQLVFTFNAGQNWFGSNFPGSSLGSIGVTKIEKIQDSLLYISYVDGQGPGKLLKIYRTSDYGAHWQNTFDSYPKMVTAQCDFHFIDDTTLVLAADGAILKSKDSGFTFDTVLLGDRWQDRISSNIRSISFVGRDTGFVAYETSVYKTLDAGDTWIKTDFAFDGIDQEYGNAINFIKAISSQKVVLGCFRGNIFKTETGGGVWSDIKDVATENAFSLYPNPTNNKLNCVIDKPTPNTTLQLFTTAGRAASPAMPVTQTNTEIDVSTLPAGLYFLQLQDDKQRVVKKFVKY